MKNQEKRLIKAEYQEEQNQEAKVEAQNQKEIYIRVRDSLIKEAVLYADGLTNSDQKHPNWNRLYFLKMDELAFKKGLQSARFHPTKKE